MRILFYSIFVLFVGAMILFALSNYAANNSIKKIVVETFNRMDGQSSQPQKKLEVVSWIPYWDQERAFVSFQKNIESIDCVGLFWYYLSPEGEVTKYKPAKIDQSIITLAHANNVKVFILVANLPDTGGGDWDSNRVGAIISSPDARSKHIDALSNLVRELGADGINIDYETLKKEQRDDFSAFIKELSDRFHREGKLVAVALHPKSGEGKPNESNGSQAQDWNKLGLYADQLHLMTYEQHNTSTSPGPSAAFQWIDAALSYAKKLIPNEKIFMGIALDGYEWPSDQDHEVHGLTTAQVQQKILLYNPTIERDDESGEAHFIYENDEGIEYEAWYNDGESVGQKLTIAQKNGLGGVGFWKLGGEDQEVWTRVMEYKAGSRNRDRDDFGITLVREVARSRMREYFRNHPENKVMADPLESYFPYLIYNGQPSKQQNGQTLHENGDFRTYIDQSVSAGIIPKKYAENKVLVFDTVENVEGNIVPIVHTGHQVRSLIQHCTRPDGALNTLYKERLKEGRPLEVAVVSHNSGIIRIPFYFGLWRDLLLSPATGEQTLNLLLYGMRDRSQETAEKVLRNELVRLPLYAIQGSLSTEPYLYSIPAVHRH